MKKICFITTISLTLKTFVVDTAKYLHENGDYDITFICGNDAEFEKSLPPYIHYIPVSMSRGVNISGFTSIKEFKKIFQEQKFDIVQYSTPNASLYASIAAKQAHVPIRLYCQWGIRYVGFSGVSRFIFKFLEKIVCNNSTVVRTVSHKNMEFAISEGLYKPDKVKVLGKGGTIGVDLSEYPLEKKAEWGKELRSKYGIEDKFVYGFSGRLSRDKGGNELLKAFRKLSAAQPNTALLIVGSDEAGKDVDAELLGWAKHSNNVVFTGMVPKADMPKYYAAMDALVHPTYREGFGMVLQEAAAIGLPVITTNVPGASEVLVDNESCLLCEAKDVDGLKKRMIDVLDRDVANKLGAAARSYVEENYERSIMLKQQFADYQSM